MLVRPINTQTYEVVAGRRRYRAAQRAGVESVPVDIRELTDTQCLEIAIVENLQRRDVHPLEEAEGFASLLRLEDPCRRRRVQSAAGEAAPRGGAGPGYRVGRAQSYRRRGSRAADERDLLFVVARLTAMLDERRIAVLIRQHGMGKPKDGEAPAKLLAAFLLKAEESKLGRILVETVVLLSMHSQSDTAKVLRDAAQTYKVDVDAISASVKQEFAAKEKGKAANKAAPKAPAKAQTKAAKKPVAA